MNQLEEAGSGRLLIDGEGLVAACGLVNKTEESIGEVGALGLGELQRLPGLLAVLELKLGSGKQAFEDGDQRFLIDLIEAQENPAGFDQDDAEEAWFVLGQLVVQEASSLAAIVGHYLGRSNAPTRWYRARS
ncbi:MAG: hypothetical protein AAF357_14420 [Verrucomicrobiota bacterium]